MNNKYLIFSEKGVSVKIERGDVKVFKEYYFRVHGGKEKAIQKAVAFRDTFHIKNFGYKVGSRFFHTKKKKVRVNSRSSELPPGISYGYSRGKVIYIVVSWSPEVNKVKRKRWNINKVGLDQCLKEAITFRDNKINELI